MTPLRFANRRTGAQRTCRIERMKAASSYTERIVLRWFRPLTHGASQSRSSCRALRGRNPPPRRRTAFPTLAKSGKPHDAAHIQSVPNRDDDRGKFWADKAPLDEERPLDVDIGLPWPEAAQASSVFSLTALFGTYLSLAVLVGLSVLVGATFGSIGALIAIRRTVLNSPPSRYGESRPLWLRFEPIEQTRN